MFTVLYHYCEELGGGKGEKEGGQEREGGRGARHTHEGKASELLASESLYLLLLALQRHSAPPVEMPAHFGGWAEMSMAEDENGGRIVHGAGAYHLLGGSDTTEEAILNSASRPEDAGEDGSGGEKNILGVGVLFGDEDFMDKLMRAVPVAGGVEFAVGIEEGGAKAGVSILELLAAMRGKLGGGTERQTVHLLDAAIRRISQVESAICLHARYAVPGSSLAYGATGQCAVRGPDLACGGGGAERDKVWRGDEATVEGR